MGTPGRALLPLSFAIDGLARGTPYTLRLRGVVTDPLLAATLEPSASVTVRTLDPPSAPPAPVLVEATPHALRIRGVHRAPVTDPPTEPSHLLVRVDGKLVDSTAEEGHQWEVEVGSLAPNSRHTVQCRYVVVDPAVDASLPWSAELVATTTTPIDVRAMGCDITHCHSLCSATLLSTYASLVIPHTCCMPIRRARVPVLPLQKGVFRIWQRSLALGWSPQRLGLRLEEWTCVFIGPFEHC
jgi:hypothetical protein